MEIPDYDSELKAIGLRSRLMPSQPAQISQPISQMMLEMQVRDLLADNEALRKRLRAKTWATVMLYAQVALAIAIWWQPIVSVVKLLGWWR